METNSPALQGKFLTTGLPGKSHILLFNTHFTDEKLSSENMHHLTRGGTAIPVRRWPSLFSRHSFWEPKSFQVLEDQVEKKDKCFNSTYKGAVFQIVVSHN